jgi:hypothetical protein
MAKQEILGLETTISGYDSLENILKMDISGEYDLKRDLMFSATEGSSDDGEWNYVFRFTTKEVSWDAPIEIIDIFPI